MKTSEIRVMNEEELAGAEINVRQQLFEARMSRATGELADTMSVRTFRRDLARILTEKGRRGRAANKES